MPDRSRLYNLLTGLIASLTLVFVVWAAVVVANPRSRLNPFPPPTAVAARVLPPLLVTAAPTLTPTSTSMHTATFTPTSTFTPTETPTPTPTVTPVIPPTSTNTPPLPTVAVTATQPPPPPPTIVRSTNTAAQAPPVLAGDFELGGQVSSFNYPDQMKQAGMTWVKRQQRWGPGSNPAEAAGYINDAHGKGFKILLTVLGDPETLRGGANYAEFATYVGEVAALGADAIEVWNEMNIDREWPAGEINPATYTELLKGAYNAIKTRNPATLVISGAPAPTGFFGGCSGAGCDDGFYIQGLVNAGALNYVDCLGIHYNEGVLSPTQTSGDPRGNPNHYTRYYQTMVDTYYNAGGGKRKLCFTELGYLSGDGYSPPLAEAAPGFAWATDTSADEQALWLAEAASLSRQSGKVRLMIVFNIDFTAWGQDPQGGYAIIRPGNGCPACETLRGVMNR
ncbi:MAG: hypothetical protein HYZ49_17010 [Chloroflexi bacterium]|nr:hypothetical protein [Chloroflexota bacterium]